jgi:hypothetical protein
MYAFSSVCTSFARSGPVLGSDVISVSFFPVDPLLREDAAPADAAIDVRDFHRASHDLDARHVRLEPRRVRSLQSVVQLLEESLRGDVEDRDEPLRGRRDLRQDVVPGPSGSPPAWVKRSVSRTSYRSNVEREARVKSDDGKSP